MRFERGKDPRSSMGIGIRKELIQDGKEFIWDNGYNVCNTTTRKRLENALEIKYGIHIGLSIEELHDKPAYLVICSHGVLNDPIRLDITDVYFEWKKRRRYTDDTGPY